MKLKQKITKIYKPIKFLVIFSLLFSVNNLHCGNNLHYSPVNEKEYQDNPIFKNDWLKSPGYSNKKVQDYNFKNKDVIIESLKLCIYWHSYIIYNPKNYEKIGFWINMYYTARVVPKKEIFEKILFDLIIFSKNVYCSEEEIYKKGDIIVFDKFNRIVRPTTEEEITDNLTNKKKF
mgnify:CR=1 FL=1